MIISLVSLKGGAGKTTLSINLAVAFAHAGKRVTLVDSDPNNRNTLKWSGLRPQDKPQILTVAMGDLNALQNNINQVNNNSDIVIIDGTPALEEFTGTIMMISDLVLLPIRSSVFDIWAFNDQFLPTLKKIRSLKPVDCRIILNATRKHSIIGREVLEVLEQYELPVMHRRIGQRTVFENSPMAGLGVMECDDKEAQFEIEMLTKEIENILFTKHVEA